VWLIDKPWRNDLHPTMKPVELVERAIRNSSQPGDMVLDPFLGAGSTIVACENLKRHACGVEIDPHYVDVSVRRWQQYTGGIAFLDSDDRSFDEVAQNGRACVSDSEDPNG